MSSAPARMRATHFEPAPSGIPTMFGSTGSMPWEIVVTADADGAVDVAHLKSWSVD